MATLPLYWHELAVQILRKQKRPPSYVKPLVGLQVAFTATVLFLACWQKASLAFLAVVPFLVLLIVLYVVGASRLRRALSETVQQSHGGIPTHKHRLLQSAHAVVQTASRLVLAASCTVALTLTYGVLSIDPLWREQSRPGLLAPGPTCVFVFCITLRRSGPHARALYQCGCLQRAVYPGLRRRHANLLLAVHLAEPRRSRRSAQPDAA